MNRRDFILRSGMASFGGLLANEAFAAKKIKIFGCQLYSVRDVFPKDPKGIMTSLAKMGYKQFESYSGKDGILWGLKPSEMKSFLGDIDAEMLSSHCDINKGFEKTVESAAEAGLKYLFCPYLGMQKSADAWKDKAELFNKKGEICKAAGIKFGYHNHDYSFKNANGTKGQMILLENCDPGLVVFELDMCWSEAAGEDSIAHLKKYAGRYELCHVKQLAVKSPAKQTDLDLGVINYSKLLNAARKNGMKHFLVEQEEYPNNSMESMASNAAFMKKLKV